MAGWYVVFNGKHPGIYQSWHECSWYVLGVRGAVYKKYHNYDQALRDYQAAMRDVHRSLAPPLPYDHVAHGAFAPIIPPSDGNGKSAKWKKVLITYLVILVVFGISMKRGSTGSYECPT